ncbi:MAG: peptide deformylase [Alphaproteobacteria bacterium]
MSVLKIITAPDPLLKQVSAPVREVDDDLRKLMDDMLETMYDAPGIGLAAIQVGVPKRVLVIDLQDRESDAEDAPEIRDPHYFVNPEIYWTSEDEAAYQEGCLSVPEFFEDVERPTECKLRYLDYNGKERDEHLTGLMATCLQHEMDHLNGILFIDHLSRLKRQMILKKLKKAEKAA